MNGQLVSTSALLSTLLLSDYRVLKYLRAAPFNGRSTWDLLREPVYLAYQPWAARYPDHVFDMAWRQVSVGAQYRSCLVRSALHQLVSEFVEYRHLKIYVDHLKFGAWQQGVASRMSSLPIQAMAAVSLNATSREGRDDRSARLGMTPVPSASWGRLSVPLLKPANASIDEYLAKQGLHETHLHLNGSSQAEVCWLGALDAPRKYTRDFDQAWSIGRDRERVRDLVRQVDPELTPAELFKRLCLAARLREWLVCFAAERLPMTMTLPQSCQALLGGGYQRAPAFAGLRQSLRVGLDIQAELEWQTQLIRRLDTRPSGVIGGMFHTYLLLQNQYYRLLVQNESSHGFDQFQKLTLTKLRDPTERTYQQRFLAMHGSGFHSVTGYVEGRIAPKDTLRELSELIRAVLQGYLHYLKTVGRRSMSTSYRPLSRLLVELDSTRPGNQRVLQLALVVHFVKLAPPKVEKLYRHYDLDQKLRRYSGILLVALRRWPRLSRWVRGIDAAANELHAPPDVFAPVFRVCRAAGLPHCTFHAGEDFRHLLSGISYMWDALNLLELQRGDRIGHGTAMGISPSLWLQRMPGRILLARGEWLTALLAAWQLVRDVPGMQACVPRLQREFESQGQNIFGQWQPAAVLERAMALRGVCRKTLLRCCTGSRAASDALSNHWQLEIDRVRRVVREQPDATALLWRWLSDSDVIKRADEIIEVDAGFLDASQYVVIQQSLMRHIGQRGVIVETLPSSNVRISQYQSFLEHHSLRWMRVPEYLQAEDPPILVSLGSDDPGIFAGDLETEFHQLYAALRAAGESEPDALRKVAAINECGRTYRFHDKTLVTSMRGIE
ncbi:hypothetical protein DFR29_11171 [Tahibacter aquaticus]|uniref:Adenosine deaminase n=1 Tax=Tahibacter aquaticus TaxID=520092 RepID=A0A4R6YSE1_9GAMM|nr:hypothetical protein DFR29_11171 [Tahibacter aquaticus]